jgi:hypothetical protein
MIEDSDLGEPQRDIGRAAPRATALPGLQPREWQGVS